MSSNKQKLPEGWCYSLMGDISQVVGGGTPKSRVSANFDERKGFPWITPADLSKYKEIYIKHGKRFLTEKGLNSCSARLMPTGTVLMSSRAPIGYIAIAANELCTSQGFKSFVCYKKLHSEYIYYWLLFKRHKIRQMGSGSTFAEISGSRAKQIPLIIVPLAEQKRFANVIKKLFAQVINAKERLDNVAETMKHFRRSVLNAACTGKLTEDWRKQKSDVEAPEDWPAKTVKEVTEKIQYGFTASSNYNIKGVKFLRITDIQNGKVDWGSVPSCEISKDKIPKYLLEKGDIVFARTGATTGKSFLIVDCPEAVFASYLIRVKPNLNEIIPSFLYIFFQSDHYWTQISEKLSGSAQPSCNATKLANLEFNKPTLVEQQEIVCRVERLFELSDKIEGRILRAREKVEKLTQSILAKAFRGELVPTEAELARIEGRDYETAEQLLERIIAEKKSEPKIKKRKMMRRVTIREFVTIDETVRLEIKVAKDLFQIISEYKNGLKPKSVLEKSKYSIDTIEEFYEELAKLEKQGKIEDYRPNDRVSLLRARK